MGWTFENPPHIGVPNIEDGPVEISSRLCSHASSAVADVADLRMTRRTCWSEFDVITQMKGLAPGTPNVPMAAIMLYLISMPSDVKDEDVAIALLLPDPKSIVSLIQAEYPRLQHVRLLSKG